MWIIFKGRAQSSGKSLIKCLKENETQMLKTDVHVEEKLMQAGNAQSSYQLFFVSFRKGFGPVVGASLFEGLRGSPYFFSLLHAAHRRNRLSLFNSLNGWCLGSRASVCPTVSCHWHQSTQPLSVSSPVGPAWQGFPSEVWNQDWEGGRVGSTSWQLHNLPKQTHTYYKSDFTLDLPAAAELCH